MPYEVKEKDVHEVLVASVTRTAPVATVGKEIRGGFATLMEVAGPIGFGDGMPGVICHELPDAAIDGTWEIFLPVGERFEPPEGIEVKTLPAGRVAFTVHVGRYDECEPAYEAVTTWIRQHGREIAGPPRELYLNDPHEVGEDQAITEVQFPIR